ncbi:putative bifunctional diguanylate cyclase/phosphodiesterase [Angustibacter aerolatus]
MGAATRLQVRPRPASRLASALGRGAPGFTLAALLVTSLLPGGSGGPVKRTALLVSLTFFFAMLVARLVVLAVRVPARRLPLSFLALGTVLWATGAATVTAGQAEAAGLTFPAPGESLYLMSYLGMAGFLLLDVPRRRLPTSAIWLEAAVVCGAATCVAALAVLSPAASIFARGGLALLLAVLYPLLDLVLGLLVLAQMLLGQRARSRRTLALAGGFLVMTAADCSFVLGLGTEAYTSNLWLDLVWGISFLLLVGAACTPPPPVQVTERQSAGWLLGAAAAVAVLILVVRPGGTTGWLVTAPAAMTLASAGVRMVQALRDARGKAEALRLSLTDELTGLPNRRALLARADAAIATDEPFGLMLLDLDGFKDINDSIGHGAGDEVLTVVANRLTDAVGPGQLLARLGGDEFALFVPSDDELTMLESAQALRASLLDPVPVEGLELSVDASVGVTACEAGDQSATALLRRADIAMYEAKRTRSGALLFDRAQDGYSRERLRRGEDLRTALTAGQLEVWYQPQVDALTHEITAVEALVRWRHPVDGLVPPAEFLPDARRAGLMTALSSVVLEQVLFDARAWFDAGHGVRVAMNCAPTELLAGQFLPHTFRELERAALPHGTLLIEVTEDSFLSDPERARQMLVQLHEHGVETAIDDYGTGFSSLSYLRDLPVQELKLDRSFCSTASTDERSRLIVTATTQMAHALGLRLVAEGVEDAETAELLAEAGVDVLQGYHVARPMPSDEVLPWMRRRAALAAAGQLGVSRPPALRTAPAS